ncbi:MAG: hypothetical protein RLZZ535_1329 [Cyanobacteriota bacterium]
MGFRVRPQLVRIDSRFFNVYASRSPLYFYHPGVMWQILTSSKNLASDSYFFGWRSPSMYAPPLNLKSFHIHHERQSKTSNSHHLFSMLMLGSHHLYEQTRDSCLLSSSARKDTLDCFAKVGILSALSHAYLEITLYKLPRNQALSRTSSRCFTLLAEMSASARAIK